MSECCREKYLNEYIQEVVEDENVRKRMLDLYEQKERELAEYRKYLTNCHERIADLENTVMELGIIIGHDKRFIREQIR